MSLCLLTDFGLLSQRNHFFRSCLVLSRVNILLLVFCFLISRDETTLPTTHAFSFIYACCKSKEQRQTTSSNSHPIGCPTPTAAGDSSALDRLNRQILQAMEQLWEGLNARFAACVDRKLRRTPRTSTRMTYKISRRSRMEINWSAARAPLTSCLEADALPPGVAPLATAACSA